MKQLSEWIRVKRRYMRSVNIERDYKLADSLQGYILTPRVVETLEQIVEAYTTSAQSRAWTITGVYGTGKSAFADLLSAMVAPASSSVRKQARRLVLSDGRAAKTGDVLDRQVGDDGMVRALVAARREPVAHTIVRAVARGAEDFWSNRPGRKPDAVHRVIELRDQVTHGSEVEGAELPELVAEIAAASKTGVLLLIDELGKLLEYAARSGGSADLYLLQQLAELPSGPKDPPVLVIGLLHQAFSEYGHTLASAERAEWEKIQGRFIDVAFTESGDQVLRLIGEALEIDPPRAIGSALTKKAGRWTKRFREKLAEPYVTDLLTEDRIASVYPVHPVAALVLPALCGRYGQNDRSLFTFLASTGPHGFSTFLEQRAAAADALPLLRLTEVYDYFLDARVGSGSRVQVSRWAEIHSIIREAHALGSSETEALKTIGVLNLVASAGPLRASRELVLAALCEDPASDAERKHWSGVLEALLAQRVLTYRKQVDEYRVWQGSDFDVEQVISDYLSEERRSISKVLSALAPLPPVVAQRHSYQTGTLRYFERQYEQESESLRQIKAGDGADGVVAYWLSEEPVKERPATTHNGRPLVVVDLPPTATLDSAARELLALLAIEKNEVTLQTDGVARQEVRRRISLGREMLDCALDEAFENQNRKRVWFGGEPRKADHFNAALSEFCFRVYDQTPVLWNELVNRRDLTSQGARAQRELISALLTAHDQPRLGIEGSGPEFSMYESLLRASGIHREENEGWRLGPPSATGLTAIWEAVEQFCLDSTQRARPVSELYAILEAPPYGAKRGIIPVLLAAVLLYHDDDVSVYQDGSFLPILGPHHFELLVKDSSRFAVKHFALSGIRQELFRELESVLRSGGAKRPTRARNATVLTVVRPLARFAKELPLITRQAEDLSAEAAGVRDALLEVGEPDRLLFESLPRALDFDPFDQDAPRGDNRHVAYRKALFDALRELQQYYARVLDSAQDQIREAFGMPSPREGFREDLRGRSAYLAGKVIEPRLRSLIKIAADRDKDHQEWLESVVMIIADKPAVNWYPDDRVAFEMKAAELSRQFLNLEALQKERAREGVAGYESRLVTITQPTGKYENRLFWVSDQERDAVEKRARRLLSDLRELATTEHQQQAILITMVEQLLKPFGPEEATTDEEPMGGMKHG